jgi:hypothetical protein
MLESRALVNLPTQRVETFLAMCMHLLPHANPSTGKNLFLMRTQRLQVDIA